MKKVILSLFLATLSAIAWALPTVQDVEAEVRQGRYTQAESMMREVIAAKPDSAKAHYIYAEILAHDGKVALAAEEARKARQLDPDVKFTDPAKFRSFEAALLQAQTPAARPAQDAGRGRAAAPAPAVPAASAGMPSWVWLAGLAVIGFLLWRGLSRARSAAAGGVAAPAAPGYASPGSGFGPAAPGAQGAPYGAGYPAPGYPPQRAGGGMLGTGLAAAGGVAAGMLASEMLHRRQGANNLDSDTTGQPGFFDSPDHAGGAGLDDRPIDFGSGGDWDSGASDAGGGSDGGGGWD